MKKKLHPLINKDSAHYDIDEKSAIEILEGLLTVTEMMGFCKANIFKHEYRKHAKGQIRSDEKKIDTYKKYLELLEHLDGLGYWDDMVELALAKSMIEYRYR